MKQQVITGRLMLYTRRKKIKNGLVIAAKCMTDIVPIATISWSEKSSDCFIKTIEDRLQTYITSYDDFLDFIRLVDEAYDMLRAAYHKQIEL